MAVDVHSAIMDCFGHRMRPEFIMLETWGEGKVCIRRSEVSDFCVGGSNYGIRDGDVIRLKMKNGSDYYLVESVTMEQLTDPESEFCLI